MEQLKIYFECLKIYKFYLLGHVRTVFYNAWTCLNNLRLLYIEYFTLLTQKTALGVSLGSNGTCDFGGVWSKFLLIFFLKQ